MFSLDGGAKYWLYNKPVDMRKSFNGLSGIVVNGMGADLRNGDVYIFMNASRNILKMLRREECGLVLYSLRLDIGRIRNFYAASGDDVMSTGISYDGLIGMVRSALDSPYVRRMKVLAGCL